MNLASLSSAELAQKLRDAIRIRKQIETMEDQFRRSLAGFLSGQPVEQPRSGIRSRFSAETRKRMSMAQRRRWKKQRK